MFVLFLNIILLLLPLSASIGAEQSGIPEKELEEAKKLFGTGPQEEDYWRTDELLLTATGSQVPVFKAPSVASLITQEDIKRIGATTLDEILQTVPGLHVYPSGLGLFSSMYAIRGINSGLTPQVLLLVNGLPIIQVYNGTRPWTYKMPTAIISRVEVIRGPGSAVHGADAFAGVINVITKDNFEIDGTETGVRYGSFNTFDTWLQHGGQYNSWDIWAGIEYQRSDGDEDRIIKKDYMDALGLSAFSNTPGYLDTQYSTVSPHLGIRKDNFTLRLHGDITESAMGPGGLQAITYGNEIDRKTFLTDLIWRDKTFTKDWDLGVQLFHLYNDTDQYYELLPRDFRNMIGNPSAIEQHGGIEVTGFYEGFNRHKMRVSLGAKYFDIDTDQYKNFGPGVAEQFGPLVRLGDTPYVYMEDQSRSLFFTTLQDEWFIGKDVTFTGGIRVDRYSDFGTELNPRAALVWEVDYYLTTKFLYGRAFRAPSFSEQHIQNNVVIKGNPDLEPETINTFELVFDIQPTKNFNTVFSVYTYTAKDQLDVVESAGSLPQSENVGEQEGRGFEVEVNWQIIENFNLRTYYSYQHSENEKTGDPVPDVPETQLFINPHYTIHQDWSFDANYYWIGGMHRAADDPREDIDDYGILNLTVRKQNIFNHLDMALSIRNVLDEDGVTPSIYEPNAPEGAYIPGDYPIEGRSVFVELSYRF